MHPNAKMHFWTCLIPMCVLLFQVRKTYEFKGKVKSGILYPRESETRELKTLDGIWNFRRQDSDTLRAFKEKWFAKHLSQTGSVIPMPVPSSYNDITVDKKDRDHVGVVWYDRKFFVPGSWGQSGYHVWLRFGGVHYSTQVWINGELVIKHQIGHLPFESNITEALQYGKENRVTVMVNNTLSQTTIPQGNLQNITTDDGIETIQSYTFDFFNYAGIHRSVHLYTTPVLYIDDITVVTDVKSDDTTGIIYYNVTVGGSISKNNVVACFVDLVDKEGRIVVKDNKNKELYGIAEADNGIPRKVTGKIEIANASLWWPYLMHPEPGYLYTMKVQIISNDTNDVYRLPVGIRSLKWNKSSLLINGKPVYFRGFGRHEDSDIRGKGLDLPLVARDYNLIKWIGANAYRTSHYPYAEEIMDFADQQGIMIIDECPAVDTINFSPTLQKNHIESLEELVNRDKNRPSVILWSIANEPKSDLPESNRYFRSISESIKLMDTTRPITAAINVDVSLDLLGQYLDIIGLNRYNAWYSNTGRLETIKTNVEDEVTKWNLKHKKPVMMLEYGADTMIGLHSNPSVVWSEEYQLELMSQHLKAFDNLRKKGFFIGEMIWNFADFNTAQTTTRMGGNRKGIFTRQRQPKASAHHLRRRYFSLAHELNGVPLPNDFDYYYISR